MWGVGQFRKYILLLHACSSPDVILSTWFKGSAARAMEEVPGTVRNAVIQWVRGIYSGWVIKVLVFSKEKWLFPAWNVRWEVNLTIQLPSKSVCVVWLMSPCHCLRSWSIITTFYKKGGWKGWWKNKCLNFLRSGKWGQYFLKFDSAMIWYAGGCQR